VCCKLEQVKCHHLSSLLASLGFHCLAGADADKDKMADRNECCLKAHLEGGSGVLPLFWAVCMLVVQLQHLVIEQLQEVNLQRCSWKPICSLGKHAGLIMCNMTQHHAHANYALRHGFDRIGSIARTCQGWMAALQEFSAAFLLGCLAHVVEADIGLLHATCKHPIECHEAFAWYYVQEWRCQVDLS